MVKCQWLIFNMRENIIKIKSFGFAIRVVKLFQFLQADKKEYILSKQLIRSGTSIGSNVEEATNAPTKKDFAHMLSIALKEAHETRYWILLLKDTSYATAEEIAVILAEITEIIAILTAILKTSRISIDS